MGKRKSVSEKAATMTVEEARKICNSAPVRSQQYKEAQAFLRANAKDPDYIDVSESESDSESDDGSDVEEDDEEEEESEKEPPKKKARSPANKKANKTVGDSTEKKKTKEDTQKKKSKPKKVIKKDYTTKSEGDDQNQVFYEASIGSGYTVKLANWLKNSKMYLQIRKSATSGCNIPFELFPAVVKAIDDINVHFVGFFRTTEWAMLPTKGTPLAAGFDLYSLDTISLSPRQTKVIETGVSVKLPENTYGRIAGRSGISIKGIQVLGGVVDPDYTGPIKIIVHNLSQGDFFIFRGQRLAQMIVEKYQPCEAVQLKCAPIVDADLRGHKNLGSTGE